MKKTTIELEDKLSDAIGEMAKNNGMTKPEWMAFAVSTMFDNLSNVNKVLDSNDVKERLKKAQDDLLIIGATKIDNSAMSPLEETGLPPVPSYSLQGDQQHKTLRLFIFFMNDGSEQQQAAYSVQEAMETLGIGDNDYLDYTES